MKKKIRKTWLGFSWTQDWDENKATSSLNAKLQLERRKTQGDSILKILEKDATRTDNYQI